MLQNFFLYCYQPKCKFLKYKSYNRKGSGVKIHKIQIKHKHRDPCPNHNPIKKFESWKINRLPTLATWKFKIERKETRKYPIIH